MSYGWLPENPRTCYYRRTIQQSRNFLFFIAELNFGAVLVDLAGQVSMNERATLCRRAAYMCLLTQPPRLLLELERSVTELVSSESRRTWQPFSFIVHKATSSIRS